MSKKTKYLYQNVDPKIRRMNITIIIVILIMIAIVAYDSFMYSVPLYYLGFYFGGLVFGRIFNKTMSIEFESDSHTFTLTTGWFQIILSILLLVVRFVVGAIILKPFHVVDVSDAVYLFFIGVYYSKWRIVLKKIDGIIYDFVYSKSSV